MARLRVLAIVQARLGSTRLPRKALLDLAGRPVLAHVFDRAACIPGVDELVLATTDNFEDEALVGVARSVGVACVRGSEKDVVDRFRMAAREFPADAILRITADCPLIDPDVSGHVVTRFLENAATVDYASNVQPPTFPDGLDTEIFSMAALERAWLEARSASDREHV